VEFDVAHPFTLANAISVGIAIAIPAVPAAISFLVAKSRQPLRMHYRDGDLRVGHRDYNCAWYRPVDETELAELCTDTSDKCHGTSIRRP
jgi:hypothetical protein